MDPGTTAPTKKAAAAARKAAAAAEAATKPSSSDPPGPKGPSPAQLTFMTKSGVPMTPTQVLSHLKQLTSNAEKALTAAPGFAPPKGGAKGKGKGKEKSDDATSAGKASGSASLTGANLAKSGLSNTQKKKDTPAPSSAGGSTAKSGRTAGGTRTEPAVPNPPYKCHVCQSPKHF